MDMMEQLSRIGIVPVIAINDAAGCRARWLRR